jgi:SnoaL-like domain
MSDLQAIADRVEIEALRSEFSDAVMMNDHDRFASLFTPGGAVRIPAGNIEAVGREQIRALGERRQGFSEFFLQTTHPGTIQLDGDTATGRACLSELARLRDGNSHLNYFVYHDRVIEPLLAGIDAAAADPDYGYQRFGDIIDELAGKLTAHLAHEESDGRPLIDASLPPPDWQHYSAVYAERIGDDASLAIPWLLDGAGPQNREAFLSNLPAPVVATLRDQWEPRYAGLNLWGTPGEQTARPVRAEEIP